MRAIVPLLGSIEHELQPASDGVDGRRRQLSDPLGEIDFIHRRHLGHVHHAGLWQIRIAFS